MIGLVNIISGEQFIPELIQEEANPENIARNILSLYKDKEKYREMKRKLSLIKGKLTDRKASEGAADAILRLLNLDLGVEKGSGSRSWNQGDGAVHE